MSIDHGLELSKVNIEVCSIILATITIAFQLSPKTIAIIVFPQLPEVAGVLGVVALIFAIILFADDIYYRGSKGYEKAREAFGRMGYLLMKIGLLLGMLSITSLLFPIPLSWLSSLPYELRAYGQLIIQLMLIILPYILWRTYKNLKIGRALWKVI